MDVDHPDIGRVSTSVMPKGVEHTVDETHQVLAIRVELSDAERR